jgi:hypothetical protein
LHPVRRHRPTHRHITVSLSGGAHKNGPTSAPLRLSDADTPR